MSDGSTLRAEQKSDENRSCDTCGSPILDCAECRRNYAALADRWSRGTRSRADNALLSAWQKIRKHVPLEPEGTAVYQAPPLASLWRAQAASIMSQMQAVNTYPDAPVREADTLNRCAAQLEASCEPDGLSAVLHLADEL